jgi:acyl-coenzyme A thioesterase PaaI-like protein
MSMLQLPRTNGCLGCGPANPYGLKLCLRVDPNTGIVSVPFSPAQEHIGFEGIIHGGLLATVLDEAMVWAATWAGKRFCVCGELSVRFRSAATVGAKLTVEARVEYSRPKLIQVAATVRTPSGGVIAAGEGKYIPMAPDQSERMMRTLIPEPATQAAMAVLTKGIFTEPETAATTNPPGEAAEEHS